MAICVISCSKEKDEAYSGLRIGVPVEQFDSQIDILVKINKLMWQEEGDSRVAYTIQYFNEKAIYTYVIPNGSPARIERLFIDVMPHKTLFKNLVTSDLKGVQLISEEYNIRGELPYTDAENFILSQLVNSFGKDYQSDSKLIANGMFDEQKIISLDTKTWLTKSYKIELKYYTKDKSHKIRVVYTPIVENTNQF